MCCHSHFLARVDGILTAQNPWEEISHCSRLWRPDFDTECETFCAFTHGIRTMNQRLNACSEQRKAVRKCIHWCCGAGLRNTLKHTGLCQPCAPTARQWSIKFWGVLTACNLIPSKGARWLQVADTRLAPCTPPDTENTALSSGPHSPRGDKFTPRDKQRQGEGAATRRKVKNHLSRCRPQTLCECNSNEILESHHQASNVLSSSVDPCFPLPSNKSRAKFPRFLLYFGVGPHGSGIEQLIHKGKRGSFHILLSLRQSVSDINPWAHFPGSWIGFKTS